MQIQERDLKILKEVGRWRVTLARHIKALVNFDGDRCCYRRLKILVDNGYLKREKILYGEPYIYSLTHKSRKLLNQNKRKNKIRLDSYRHDVAVLDTVLNLIEKYNCSIDNFISEQEMHRFDGFGNRRHYPDFVLVDSGGKKIAGEIELSLKAFNRLEQNIKDNYLTYDGQLWFTLKSESKIIKNITKLQERYDGIQLNFLDNLNEIDEQQVNS